MGSLTCGTIFVLAAHTESEAGSGGPVYTSVDAEELKEGDGGGGVGRKKQKRGKQTQKDGEKKKWGGRGGRGGGGHGPSPCRVTLVTGYL